ncbi:MAG: GAF domain-containing protein [Chloroflexi bacterium]|nr:GAF domain-containing protein [Chloroflexota bacterium]
MFHRWRRDLRVQLIALYALVVIAVLAGLWFFAQFAERRLVADVEAADRALAQSIALETETSLRFALEAVGALAQNDAVIQRDYRALETLFGTTMLARRDLILVYLLDEHGVMRFHYPLGPGSTIGWNFSFRDYFRAARAKGHPVLSKGRISPTTQKPVVTAAAPVYTQDGRFRGVVGTNIALERLSEALRTIALEQSEEDHTIAISIFDHTGQLVADSNAEHLLHPAFALSTWPEGERARTQDALSTLHRAPDGTMWLYTYVRMPQTSWVVLVRRPASEALATLTSFRQGWLLAVLLFLFSGAFFGIVLHRSVLSPLARMTVYSRALGRHRTQHALTRAALPELTSRTDQIGELARALIEMENALQRRFRELDTLLETSHAVVSTLNPDEVITRILEQVKRLLGVHISALLVYDVEEGVYKVKAARGLSPLYAREMRRHPDDPYSPTMQAIRERRPVQVADVTKLPRTYDLAQRAEREGYRALLAVPLLTREAPPAALLLYHTQPHYFTSEEIDLAMHFANHAAMALEHAVLYEQSNRLRYLQTLRLEAVIQSVQDGLIVESLEGQVLYINRAAERLLQCKGKEVVGKPIQSLAECTEDPVRSFLLGDVEEPVDVSLETPDGRRDVRLLVVPVREEDGTVVGRVKVLRDVTRERELDRAKSALLSAVSHELRTPLAGIKGYVSSLLAEDVEWDEATRREFLLIISQEADRLQRLVSNLLDMSRLEAGTLTIRQDVYHLGDIVARVLRTLNPQEHPIQVDIPEDLPPVYVDAARVEVVLRNLLENALKYTPPGRPVRVRAFAEGDHVVVRVEDRGPGIPPEHRERIFDRFYRVPGVRAGGAGLGLAICKGFVEAHGGRIWVEENPGGGAVFAFTLPIAQK